MRPTAGITAAVCVRFHRLNFAFSVINIDARIAAWRAIDETASSETAVSSLSSAMRASFSFGRFERMGVW
ncbi:MAG: hypothetical protein ACJAYU_001381 [Bradymonadia bacterium]|jgi:hypothetical protein